MKFLLSFLDKLRPSFEEGGKLGFAAPFFEAMDTLLFSTATVTRTAPHVRDPLDVKRFMTVVIVSLIPCVLASIYLFGLRVVALILVSYAAGGTVEVLFAIVRREKINEGFFVTGLVFPLILPPGLPFWMAALGVAFGVVFGKELFGGTGRNVFNPALVGRCFLALAYPAAMTSSFIKPGSGAMGNSLTWLSTSMADAVTSATPLVQAKQGVLAGIPEMLWGGVAGCAAETSVVAIVLGGALLLFTRVGSWRTVVAILAGAAVLQGLLHASDPSAFASAPWHLCAGGLLFGAMFMATDPVTSPATNAGKWVYGSMIGAVAILIRNFTGYVEGMMFAILLGNIVAPIIDEVTQRVYLRRLRDL